MINHPGIKFPKSCIKIRPTKHVIDYVVPDKVIKEIAAGDVTDWGVSTAVLAKILNMSQTCTRQILHRRHVAYKMIRKNKGGALSLYWSRDGVDKILHTITQVVAKEPEGYVFTAEALAIMNCSNTSLLRECDRGVVRKKRIRLPEDNQLRVRVIYNKEDLLALKSKEEEGVLSDYMTRLNAMKILNCDKKHIDHLLRTQKIRMEKFKREESEGGKKRVRCMLNKEDVLNLAATKQYQPQSV